MDGTMVMIIEALPAWAMWLQMDMISCGAWSSLSEHGGLEMVPPSSSEFSDGGTCCLQMLTRDLCGISTATGLYTRVLSRLSLLIPI